MECIFVGDHVTHFSFSLSFPGFSCKNSNFLEFSLDFDNFSNSLSFPGLWPPWISELSRIFRFSVNIQVALLKMFQAQLNQVSTGKA